MLISILNLKYSPNLGDAVVAECLEQAIAERVVDARVQTVDISGREGFGHSGSITGGKLKPMTRLRSLPGPLHRFVVFHVMRHLTRHHYASKWVSRLADSDLVVVGGGHLLSDVEYYFPIRISTALGLVREATPLHFFAVGISGAWSDRGIRLLKRAIARLDLGLVGARDTRSLRNWHSQFDSRRATLCRDPGLIAADVFDLSDTIRARLSRVSGDKPCVAVGVSDPNDLALHANGGQVCGASDDFFQNLAGHLLKAGLRVTFFSNGTVEDDAYLQSVRRRTVERFGERADIVFEPRPRRPLDLAAFIARQDVLIAHRLHANIVAFSCLVPHVGLGWDPKVESFFESVDRGRYCVTQDIGAGELCQLAVQTLQEGINREVHARVLDEVRAAIDALVARFRLRGDARSDIRALSRSDQRLGLRGGTDAVAANAGRGSTGAA